LGHPFFRLGIKTESRRRFRRALVSTPEQHAPGSFSAPIDALIDVDRLRATEAGDEFDQKLENLDRKPLTKPAAIPAFQRCCMRTNFAFNDGR